MQSSMRSHCLPLLLKTGFAVALALTFAMGSASADPSTLQMGGNSATGTDPVRIDDSGLVDINEIKGASVTFSSFQLILGIPNPEGSSFSPATSSITSVNGNTNSSSATNGWSYDSSLTATMTSSDNGAGQDAYSLLGLTSPNSSNNGTNWFGAEQTYNSFTPTTISLYVFDITANLAEKGTVAVQFSSLPVGTYAIVLSTGSDSKSYGTPFTVAGLTTGGGGGGGPGAGSAPAPPSVVLLGFGGLGLAFILARSRRRLAAV